MEEKKNIKKEEKVVKEEKQNKSKKDGKTIAIIVESIVIGVLVIIIIIMAAIMSGNNTNAGISLPITISSDFSSDNNDISISKNNNQNNSGVVKINFNETVTKENKYELTVLGINFGKTILPPNTSSYYSYYEAKEEGHQYLELKYNYKNLDETNIRADKVASITIKYNNKYEYTGSSIIEDSEGDFTYTSITNIAPLTTGKLHYLFDVPDEVANGDGPIVATIKCGSDTYEITLR